MGRLHESRAGIKHTKAANVPIGGGVHSSSTAMKIYSGGSAERKEWTPGQFTMVDEDVVKGRATPNSVPETDGWSTRCWCPWRGSSEGSRGHEEHTGASGGVGK